MVEHRDKHSDVDHHMADPHEIRVSLEDAKSQAGFFVDLADAHR